ncbi:hypothetical protein [Coleofasciculus sp. F4-SAH-05]|uniref:hypothetical protein n=1 Tax=Coleofasciculus sp. F4-SAH-05 TaxID=3069525 RepID=UPI003304A8E6
MVIGHSSFVIRPFLAHLPLHKKWGLETKPLQPHLPHLPYLPNPPPPILLSLQ